MAPREGQGDRGLSSDPGQRRLIIRFLTVLRQEIRLAFDNIACHLALHRKTPLGQPGPRLP